MLVSIFTGKVNHPDHLMESKKKEAILVLNWVAAVSVPLYCNFLAQERSKRYSMKISDFGIDFKKHKLEKI